MRPLFLAAALAISTLASAQILDSRTFSTDGHPMLAIWTPDGQHVLVTVTNQRESGIEIFRVDGAKLKREAYQPIGNENAQGILLLPRSGLLAVGLALFDHDRKLLVANSNRFTNGPGSATVIDLADPAKPTILQTIKTGQFPRNITASPDGKTLLLTVYTGNELMLLTMR